MRNWLASGSLIAAKSELPLMTTSVVEPVRAEETTVAASNVGRVFGLFQGGLYLLWALLVASGAAQSVMDFIFRLHFIHPVYVTEEIDAPRIVVAVLLSAAAGYAFGGAFALFWNHKHHLQG